MTYSTPNNGHNPAEGQGVALSSLSPSAGQTSDTRLCERAIRERWPMDEATRLAVLDRLRAVVNDPGVSPRESIAACKALIAADAVNIQAERLEVAREAAAKPVPVSNNVTIVESDDWYGTRAAVGARAAIDADPRFLDWLRERELGTVPNPFAANVPPSKMKEN